MGIFSFLRKSNSKEDGLKSVQQAEPNGSNCNVPGCDNDDNGSSYIRTGTGYPIDVIYHYVRTDFEKRGYNDAMTSMDISYMTTGKQLIENELRTMFKQIKRRYADEIVKLEPMIANTKALLLADMVSQLESRLATYREHIAEIDSLREQLDNHSSEMDVMSKSYERGFARGITAITTNMLDNLKNENNEI